MAQTTDDEKVRPLFADQQPEMPDPGKAGTKMLRMIIDIAAARSLLLIALLGAVGIWTWAVYDPLILRLYTACGFSVLVLVPLTLLYYRRG